MDYKKVFSCKFKGIIEKYAMKCEFLDENQFAIIGKEFALIFTIHLGRVFVRYIMPGKGGELEVYNFDLFITEKFGDDDRAGIQKATTPEEMVLNEITVLTRGLINHWNDLLEGKKNWIEEYYLRFGVSGEPYKAHKTIAGKIGHLIQR
ncbi:hypothetical protein [Anaerosinus gibii]|uniref:Uncharacterized protein n=1 Tax=Selenobaculum gibii TaxID=3054208 RepID=A0A9Y2AIZ6_9FIRM|nr:hypothetical protein [Selenobaculum gbiensis]WIW70883.1 hypothetical protein P3F81_00730 [Selenobaculum gbiensis]